MTFQNLTGKLLMSDENCYVKIESIRNRSKEPIIGRHSFIPEIKIFVAEMNFNDASGLDASSKNILLGRHIIGLP